MSSLLGPPSVGNPERREPLVVVLAVTVALLLVLSALIFHFGSPATGPTSPTPVTGLSFDEALSVTNSTVGNESGGPWTLFSVIGIAAPDPVWPFTTLDYPADCQSVAGPSIWNSSKIPTTSDLTSGVLPFWSLLYFNANDSVLAGVTTERVVQVIGPILPSTPCGHQLAPLVHNATKIQPPIDSTGAANVAWAAAGASYVSTNRGAVAYFKFGVSQLGNSWSGPAWTVIYWSCGLPGYGLNQNFSAVGVTSLSNPPTVLTGYFGCSLSNFALSFLNQTTMPGQNGTSLTQSSITVGSTVSGITIPNTVGLVSWMSDLNLTNTTSGHRDPLATVLCNGTALGLASCRGSAGGWYAALVAPGGAWLDVYSNRSGTPGWLYSNVPVYSGDFLTVSLPMSWTGTAQSLSAGSTTTQIAISGSTSL
jgi:hypothetical protein